MPRLHVPREPKPEEADTSAGSSHRGRRQSNLSAVQGHFVAASGEFVGTLLFLYFSYAGQVMLTTQASEMSLQNGQSSSQKNIFTALLYGFSLLVNAWAFYRISGGLFNPAVCIAILSTLIVLTRYTGHLGPGPRGCTSGQTSSLSFSRSDPS
jgi:aquaporin related protein